MGTHRVSTSAAMRFLVLVFCFITLTVVAAANGSNNDHDSDSLVPQQAEESFELDSGSLGELPAEDDDDEALDSRAKAACKKQPFGRCIRVKNRHNCKRSLGWCATGGRRFCGRKRICCHLGQILNFSLWRKIKKVII